jgi:N-acetylneuraminate synthase
MPVMKIAGRQVGDGAPCFIIGEAGICHNGDTGILRKMIDVAGAAGCSAVKGQKRTVNVVYTAAELAAPRPGPWGATNGDLKRLLELDPVTHAGAMEQAKSLGMTWSASPWDVDSVAVLADLEAEWVKVASASITDEGLVKACGRLGVPVIMSTGMSTTAEIDRAVEWVCSTRAPALALLHTCSAYPSAIEDLHLHRIEWLRERYQCVVGYSGHESGVLPSVEAVRMGASIVERHITLDRSMWGSDQAASLEPGGLRILVRAIRELEALEHSDEHSASDCVAIAEVAEVMRKQARNRALSLTARGTAGERVVLPSEAGPRAKLRKP